MDHECDTSLLSWITNPPASNYMPQTNIFWNLRQCYHFCVFAWTEFFPQTCFHSLPVKQHNEAWLYNVPHAQWVVNACCAGRINRLQIYLRRYLGSCRRQFLRRKLYFSDKHFCVLITSDNKCVVISLPFILKALWQRCCQET